MSLEMLGNYDHLPIVPVTYGLSIIVSAMVFFTILNYNVNQLTSSAGDTWKWRNLFISWIHALIVGVWDLTCFYYYPELTSDLIAFNNLYIYSLVAFSTGYFLYDFLDIVISGRLSKMWEVVPHHIAVAGMFFYNVVESRCVAYNVVALLSEVNTIFLHSRKLLQMHNWPFDHWLYRLNSALNLLTFMFCRFLGITWIVYGMFVYYERVSRIYLWVLGAAMFVMWVTNVLLFWRLLQSDVVRPYLRRSQTRQAKDCSFDLKGPRSEDVIASDEILTNHLPSRNDDYKLRKRNKSMKVVDGDGIAIRVVDGSVANRDAKIEATRRDSKSGKSLEDICSKGSAPGSSCNDGEVCRDVIIDGNERLVTENGESPFLEHEVQSSLFTETGNLTGGHLPGSNGDHGEGKVDLFVGKRASPAISSEDPATSDFIAGRSPKITNGELIGHG